MVSVPDCLEHISAVLQLLGQLDSSGAPPASAETISKLPVCTLTKDQVRKFIRYSWVCWLQHSITPVRYMPWPYVVENIWRKKNMNYWPRMPNIDFALRRIKFAERTSACSRRTTVEIRNLARWPFAELSLAVVKSIAFNTLFLLIFVSPIPSEAAVSLISLWRFFFGFLRPDRLMDEMITTLIGYARFPLRKGPENSALGRVQIWVIRKEPWSFALFPWQRCVPGFPCARLVLWLLGCNYRDTKIVSGPVFAHRPWPLREQ